ncbi:HEPN domain-containing protein, partial [candidate division WOR-3 bacterium]|nr:HEPN domain-containing protein [candidate division WOR-3 bacterium]
MAGRPSQFLAPRPCRGERGGGGMKPEYVAELVKHRMEQARAALSDARFLLDGQRTPQAVINRSYYAMFYAALALLQTVGKTPSKHTGVIGIYDTEFMRKGVFPKESSIAFHDAFDARLVSDYQPVRDATRDAA